ncbi:MAG TPA: DEAD/DEAH box helicase [Vicinamibacterales bacterium]
MNTNSAHARRPSRRKPGGGRGGRRGPSKPFSLRPSTPAPDLPWEIVDVEAAPIAFDSMGFDARLESGFHSLGFEGTRPVQGAVIPVALEGHDVVACAETGTGKTLAFAAPIIERLLSETPGYGDPARENYTRALILAPTRELAVQIEDSLVGLTYHTPVTSAAVFGGVEMGPQERALQAGVDIVVATPGRLMDHMRHSNTDFVRVQVLVLDEADRMMDMGFWPDVQKIMAALPPDRQTLLFSATLPGEIQRMAKEMLKSPRYVQVGVQGGAARTIDHQKVDVERDAKIDWLATFAKRDSDGPVLVFVRRKVDAARVTRHLVAKSIRAAALHADRSQQERLSAVEGFRSGKHPVLVATDIAARGLDIEGIAHVINFEVPDSPDTYVHRVGRTGRSGASGHAVTLVSPHEQRSWSAVENALGIRAR